jgi:hypothetical protein
MTITLVQHRSFPETDDNWNLQSIHVFVQTDGGGQLCILNRGDPDRHIPPVTRLTGGGHGDPRSIRLDFIPAASFGRCPGH